MPAVDADKLRDFFTQNQLFGLISAFTGGSLTALSIGMLGLGPYITGSIIMQLLTMIFPSLEQMYKYEGEAGRAKFNQYSRLLTVPLAVVQGFAFLTLLSKQGVINQLGTVEWIATLVTITAGSVFLMWLGELITEKNIGNGVSILILAGIVFWFSTNLKQTTISLSP